MKALRWFVSWLKGDCPLVVTYWVTGVIPGLIFYGAMASITALFEYGSLTPETGLAYLMVIMACIIIYTPFSLWAITASAIKYEGLLLWRILALLAVAKGVFSYIQGVFLFLSEMV